MMQVKFLDLSSSSSNAGWKTSTTHKRFLWMVPDARLNGEHNVTQCVGRRMCAY